MQIFLERPGYLFVLATLLPLVSFLLIFLASGMWCLARRYNLQGMYQLFGGDKPGKLPAYLAIGAIGLAFVLCAAGFVLYHRDEAHHHHAVEDLEQEISKLETDLKRTSDRKEKEKLGEELHAKEAAVVELEKAWEKERDEKWRGDLLTIVRVRPAALNDPERGGTLSVGFAIDSLSTVMFVMVTFIATLIHLFSVGYMSEEEQETVEDHHVYGHHHHAVGTGHDDPVHPQHEHYKRRGRFGRFFMYLSLFCFSMLNLVLANNLFQVFISWELVGVCSYLLIGFYFERQSASNAANKAFITNRVGDAGFILGLLIVFGYFGTFNFAEVFSRVRSPIRDSHEELALAGKIVRAEPVADVKGGRRLKVTLPGEDQPGSQVVIFPRNMGGHFHGLGPHAEHEHEHGAKKDEAEEHPPEVEVVARDNPTARQFSSIPYWMLVAAGLGIFLGCVGKSAQFPLQVWLPDAMEGPTPVSALIHAATMVAAGVYLVGRCYPLFTPEVLLVIAYTGGITLFVAATIAIVMTDIKKVLAYSTVSQLGYMMLALGVGGWVAGLFHLITHAFFKALLFLGSGSVIYGCHHEQEMTKMGGLYPKMKITALTMLAGVFAIAGIPLFSGWYSKDSILAHAIGFVWTNPQHILLFLLPLVTAGITTFYMFRMWFLTFTGEPRDEHVHEHAHESPWTMTVPLVVLAFFSICVAWGWPLHDAAESALAHKLHHAQPTSVLADFGQVTDIRPEKAHHTEHWVPGAAAPHHAKGEHGARQWAHQLHDHAGWLALVMVALGIVFAVVVYYWRVLDPAEAKEQFPQVHAFLENKWYFDHLYSVLLVRPAMVVARAFRWFDLTCIDGVLHGVARGTVRVSRSNGRFDNGVIDGIVNLIGNVTYAVGGWLRGVQTGFLRSYVLFLVLAAIGCFVMLSYFVAMATAG
jgi:NADH-quinone oxidoreductase subunit L